MFRKAIACVLIVTYLANMGCSNLPVPLPGVVEDVFPGVAEDVTRDLAIRQVAAIWKDDIPIQRTEHTLYPTVERLPGAEFTPTPLPSNLEDNTPIAPGDYEVPAHFYCTGHYMRNGSGYRYRLAKLEGKFSEALTQLYVRASQAGTSSSDVQVLSWSLQAGVAYEDLGSREQALVDRLIPEYRAQMQLGFTEKLMRDWDTWSSRMPVPSFNEALAKMGDVGAYIRTLMDARQEIINKDYNYHALASVFVTESDAAVPIDPEKTPWSRVQDRIFMRFVAPRGALHDGVIQIRILDGHSQPPQASHTTAVTEAHSNQAVESLAWSTFGQMTLADSTRADALTFTTIAASTAPAVKLPSLILRLPSGAILWVVLLGLIVASIALSDDAQSLTATVNRLSRKSEPVSKPVPIPRVEPMPRSTPEPPPECVEQAKRLSTPDFKVIARAGQAGGDPLANLFCQEVTKTPCEYSVYPRKGGKQLARFDAIKGRDVFECKCGYKSLIEKSRRGGWRARQGVDKMLKQALAHSRLTEARGLTYWIIVSNDTVADFLREQLGESAKIAVREWEPCD